MAQRLKSFTVDNQGEEYLLRIEGEDGTTAEFTASYEQLDVIAEAIDDRLDEDEEAALEVQGGE
jgi:hypothetical protein